MALRRGTHEVGPDAGTMEVHTYREGMAQKVGHDLIIEVGQWGATVEVGEDGGVAAASLEADSTSLQIREGLHGLKPLSDRDRAEIRKNIDGKILHKQPIEFRSNAIVESDGGLHVEGDLTMAGETRPATFDLDLADDGSLSGTLSLTQSEWGIKPYRGLMGALKVRDDLEVVLDVKLPAG